MKTMRIKILFFSLLCSTVISSIIFSSERLPEELFDAIGDHNQQAIKSLLGEEKINVNWQHHLYGTPLIHATNRGNNKAIILLIIKQANIDHQCYPKGPTPLTIAASDNRPEIVQLLLAGKAEPGKTIMYGRTALILAADRGNLTIVKQLLESKADAEQHDDNGNKALAFAQKNSE